MKTKLELAVLEYLEGYHRINDYEDGNPFEMLDIYEHFIQMRKNLKTPSKFYKFRTCNKMNFDTLKKNCIWMPSAEKFIDSSDCNVTYDYDLKSSLISMLSTKKGYMFCLGIARNCLERVHIVLTCDDLDKIGSAVEASITEVTIDNHRQELSCILEEGKALLYFEYVEHIYESYRNHILKLPNKLTHVTSETRKYMYVYSMTSIMDNSLLWENYANRYSGFCIEYSIPEYLYYSDDRIAQILPVIYKKRIPTVSIASFNLQDIDIDSLNYFKYEFGNEVTMQLLYKYKDYEYEHEWRMIGAGLSSSLQSFPYVSRIIVGKNINDRNFARIKNIAKKLGVPVVKQIFDVSLNKHRYIEEQICRY